MTAYVRPRTLAEATAARANHPDWAVVAGGTDLMVGAPERPAPRGLIDLFGLPDITGVRPDGSVLHIGAATTYAEILADSVIREELPALWSCVREIGAVQIQARGTIGGNVCTSSPVGDTLPVLLAMHATLELASVRGRRRVRYDRFLTGYRKTALERDELVTGIEIALPPPGTRQFWRKVGTRRAQAISKVMVAAVAGMAGGRIEGVHLAMGAVANRPIRLPEAENLVRGEKPTEELAERVRASVAATLQPIDDVRSSADYRRDVAANLAKRFVLSLAD